MHIVNQVQVNYGRLYGIGQTIIFSSCGFFLSSLFSSPNLSGGTLDVYRTATHIVALVGI